MAFNFEVKHDVEVPNVPRGGGGQALGLPFDSMKAGSHIFVPNKFWIEEREMKQAELKVPDLKDRIRRSFYGWQGDDAARKKLTLVMVEHKNDKGIWDGLDVYMTNKDGTPSKKK